LNIEGTTVIQVTHKEECAGYGQGIIQVEDGWIVDE
jgi:ABC-type lipoprotein export system ATPase subunit